jgi:hypothetical protein
VGRMEVGWWIERLMVRLQIHLIVQSMKLWG